MSITHCIEGSKARKEVQCYAAFDRLERNTCFRHHERKTIERTYVSDRRGKEKEILPVETETE